MAHVEKRGDKRYRARWTVDGRERSKTFTRKADAERFLATVQADLLRGSYVDPHDRTTVAAYARQWAAGRPHRPATAQRVRQTIETHIAGTSLGDRRLASIRPSDVQTWVSDRSRVLAPSTLRVTVGLLRSIFAAAALDRLIGTSPVVRLQLPTGRRDKVVPLTVEQVRALADEVPPRYRAMVLAQAGLGLRLGELLALRTCDVDFLRRLVRIEHQIGELSRQREEPKTASSRRSVPLPQVVAEALSVHVARWPQGADGSLFVTDAGVPYTHNHYGSFVLKKAAVRAGLPTGTTCTRCGTTTRACCWRRGRASSRSPSGSATTTPPSSCRPTVLMPNSEDRTRAAVDAAWSPTDGLVTAWRGGAQA